MKFRGIASTKQGVRREHNEDHFIMDDPNGLYIVCDGMGGHRGGEVASRETAEAVKSFIQKNRKPVDAARSGTGEIAAVEALMKDALLFASQKVSEMAARDLKLSGMGCSCTLVLTLGQKAVMAHVGDTRLYLNRNGTAHQLSRDHTFAADLARAGVIEPEEVYGHPYAHVLTQAVGRAEPVLVDTLVFDILHDDILVLASDGILSAFHDVEVLADALSTDFKLIPDILTQQALTSGSTDDITVVAVRARSDDAVEEVLKPAIPADFYLDAVENCTLFKDLSVVQRLRVRNIGEEVIYRPGHTIIDVGKRCRGLYLVVSGALSISRDNRELHALSRGEAFGAAALIAEFPARTTLSSVGTTHVLVISRNKFNGLMAQFPRLGNTVVSRLVRHMNGSLDTLFDGLKEYSPKLGEKSDLLWDAI